MNFCLWVTGLPGCGKSTIAKTTQAMGRKADLNILILNLDQIRKVLTPEPQYTEAERELVYRALVLMADILVDEGNRNVIIDATGNRRRFRDLARELISEFAEIYVKCPLEISQEREASRRAKNGGGHLYERAKAGHLAGGLPGLTAPYEPPENPEIELHSDELTPYQAAKRIMAYVNARWGSSTFAGAKTQ